MPKNTSDFTFEETIAKLTTIFGLHESLFNIRYKCLNITKSDLTDNFTYGGIVNKMCEKFKFSSMTDDQFKCLIFVMGLKSQSDLDIRTKLLEKLEKEHTTISLDTLISEYEQLTIVKKDSNLIQSKATSACSFEHCQLTKEFFQQESF